MIFEDQLAALEADSKRIGTQGQNIDFALLVDGLAAEREQGITIDVAYRFFATDRRKFIVADTPGHEQYTRNMVTGASTADLAVILIDARKGVLTQTRRHSYLAHLHRHPQPGAGGQQDGSGRLRSGDITTRSSPTIAPSPARIGIADLRRRFRFPGSPATTSRRRSSAHSLVRGARPARASGDASRSTPPARRLRPFRMPVQWVNRPNAGFPRLLRLDLRRARSSPATRCACCPRAETSTVSRIVTQDGDLDEAVAGQSVTHHPRRRGRLLAAATCSSHRGRSAARSPISSRRPSSGWRTRQLLPGRPYWLKLGTQTVTATIHSPKYQINVNTMEHLAAKTLELNAIGVANLSTDRPIGVRAL